MGILEPFLIAQTCEVHKWLLFQLSHDTQAFLQIFPWLPDKAKNL